MHASDIVFFSINIIFGVCIYLRRWVLVEVCGGFDEIVLEAM